MVGYDTVVNLAHRAGISEDVKATPAMAIGSYDATPLEMAGAYTIFANQRRARAADVSFRWSRSRTARFCSIRSRRQSPCSIRASITSWSTCCEEVMRTRHGGGRARARLHGARGGQDRHRPHDGWFAGFTSDLLCIVWVGFDDNRELDIEGAHSALPIWTEFMKRAIAVAPLCRRQTVRGAQWRGHRHHRSGIRHAGHPAVPDAAVRRYSSPAPNPSAPARCMAAKAIAPRCRDGTRRQLPTQPSLPPPPAPLHATCRPGAIIRQRRRRSRRQSPPGSACAAGAVGQPKKKGFFGD